MLDALGALVPAVAASPVLLGVLSPKLRIGGTLLGRDLGPGTEGTEEEAPHQRHRYNEGMRVATGKIRGGQVVVDDGGEPLPEGGRVTLVIEERPQGFHLDAQSQQELLEAMREIDRGDFVTEEELFAELAQLK